MLFSFAVATCNASQQDRKMQRYCGKFMVNMVFTYLMHSQV